MTRIIRMFLAISFAVITTAAVALASPASAQPPPADHDWGLTSTQRATLEHRVDRALATTRGGERISANQIAWDDGAVVLTLAVPGVRSGSRHGCSYENVCLYSYRAYQGDRLSFFRCGVEKLRNYGFTNRTTSWVNNQTGGTYSELRYWTGSSSRRLTGMTAYDESSWPGSRLDNRADFVKVC